MNKSFLILEKLKKRVFLLPMLVIGVGFIFSSSVYAGGSSGPGGPVAPKPSTCGSSNNTRNKLCPESGSKAGENGGGASWRLYSSKGSDDIKIEAYSNITKDAHIKGCGKVGWYLRYGYERLKYIGRANKSNYGEQIGVLSITGNDDNKYASDRMRGHSGKKKIYFNEYKAESIDENTDVGGLLNLVGEDGVKIRWDSVTMLFEKMKKYDQYHGTKYTENFSMTDMKSVDGDGYGLGYFCFSPDVLKKTMDSKSSVSINGSGRMYTREDAHSRQVKKEYTIKKGGTARISFGHYLIGNFNPADYDKFKNQYQIHQGDNEHNINSPVYGGSVDENSGWVGANTFMGGQRYKHEIEEGKAGGSEKLIVTISYDENKAKNKQTVTVCQSIGSFYTDFNDDGSPKTTPIANRISSSACAVIKFEDAAAPPPASGLCFNRDVIEASDDKGYNATWSYVRNQNKGGAFPDDMQTPTTNSLASGLAETAVNKAITPNGSTVSIFAKPLDKIQFRHVFCFGAQAVKSLSLEDAKAGKSRGYRTPESIFSLSGDNGPIYGGAISGGQISFKSGEDGKVRPPGSPVRSDQWGRAYDDSHSEGHSVEVSNTGNTISEKVTIGSNSKAWVGGSIERNFKWDKPLIDDKTEFTDGSDVEMHKGSPSACGCNATDNASKIIPSNTYGLPVDLDLVNGLEYKQCKQNGECDKKCKPLPPAPGAPSSPPQYPRDCGRRGNCKFNNFEEDKDNAYKLFPLNTSDGSGTTTTTQVKVPYNFNTKMESAPTFTGSGAHEDGGVVFAGERVSAKGKISILRRENPVVSSERLGHGDKKYATKTPEMRIKTLAFTIRPGTTYDGSGINGLSGQIIKANDISAWGLPPAIKGVAERNIFEATRKVFNNNGDLQGSVDEDFDLNNLVVPDAEVGTKLCVIAAVYPADSHGIPDDDILDNNNQEDAMEDQIMNNKSWRLSPAACRTIAKKPSLQAWNGGVISGGAIKGAIARKYEGVLGKKDILNPKDLDDQIHAFGSWSEYELTAKNEITDFGSGAALGYFAPSLKSGAFALPGGKTPSSSDKLLCEISQLTIANTGSGGKCERDTEMGKSDITIDHTILERLKGRYGSLKGNKPNDDKEITLHQDYFCEYGASGYSPKPLTSGGDTLTGGDPECAANGTRLISGKNVTIAGSGFGSPKTFILNSLDEKAVEKKEHSNNTMVIKASDSVSINSDIYYGDIFHRNSFKNIAAIPQLLIFAPEIYIDASVKNVDAWLIADNIYTCAQGVDKDKNKEVKQSIEAATSEASASNNAICGKQLRINGPVFVGSNEEKGNFSLLRHAGAYPGGGSTGKRDSVTNPILNADGSVTPAEIFNLRLDAYLWAYSQAERLTQAFVTYSRELPPRY